MFSLSGKRVHTIRCRSDEAPFYCTWGLSISDTKTNTVSHIQFCLCAQRLFGWDWGEGGSRNSRQLSELMGDSLVSIFLFRTVITGKGALRW